MPYIRQLRDANFIWTTALPAAGNSNTTAVINLRAVNGDADPSLFDINVDVPALPNHTDTTKVITFTVQDSADGSAFANVAPLIQCQVPGVASTGSAETVFTFRLPPTVRQYVQIVQAVPAGDGNNTAASPEVALLF
jgi:hypothetical protein